LEVLQLQGDARSGSLRELARRVEGSLLDAAGEADARRPDLVRGDRPNLLIHNRSSDIPI
jgi:hypothetical protein